MLINEEKAEFLKKIEKNIYLVDRELQVIDKEILIRKSKLDILALDNIGKLILIEVDTSNPETLIFKALDHFDWILHNMPILQNKYKSYSIDSTVAPEIIFLSKEFSENFQRRISYVNKAKVHLYQLKTTNNDKIEICPVEFSSVISPITEEEKTPEQIITVINSEDVREKCRKCIGFINSLKDNLDLNTKKGIIQFNYQGSYFAAIYPFESFFWVNFNPDYWSGKKIDKYTKLDFNTIIS